MNAFIRPIALGDLDGPSLAVEDTIPVAGLKTIPATDALCNSGDTAGTPNTSDSRSASVGRRRFSHAPAVRRALAAGWHIDTRVRHDNFGAAAAVANGWVQAALAADFTGGLRVGAALHGICGYKPSYAALPPSERSAEAATTPFPLPLYCIGALAPDMRTLIDLAATLDDTFDEALSVSPMTVNVGWLASDQCTGAPHDAAPRDEAGGSYLSAKDWSLVQALLVDACENHAPRDAEDQPITMASALPSRNHTIRLPGLAHAAAAAALISRVAGRANEAGLAAPSPEDLGMALHHANVFRREVDQALRDVDVLALPTLHTSHGELNALTGAFNLSGHPAVTLPFLTGNGRVHALQLIARHGDDARLCAAGSWFEALFARHPAAQWNENEPIETTLPYAGAAAVSTRTAGSTTPH